MGIIGSETSIPEDAPTSCLTTLVSDRRSLGLCQGRDAQALFFVEG